MHIFYSILGLLPLGWIINGVLTYSAANSAYPKDVFPEERRVYFNRSFLLMLAGSLLFVIADGSLSWLLSMTEVWQEVSPALFSIISSVSTSLSSAPSEWLIVIVICGLIGFLLGRG